MGEPFAPSPTPKAELERFLAPLSISKTVSWWAPRLRVARVLRKSGPLQSILAGRSGEVEGAATEVGADSPRDRGRYRRFPDPFAWTCRRLRYPRSRGAYSSGLLVLVDLRSTIKGNASNREKRPAGQASEHQAWEPGCGCLEACLLVLRREMACRRTYP